MRYELTEELKAQLGGQREYMACIHAKHLLTGLPYRECFLEAQLPIDFDWRKDLTVWEMEIGLKLAELLRPEFEREQEVLRKAAADRKAKADRDAKLERCCFGVEKAREILAKKKVMEADTEVLPILE